MCDAARVIYMSVSRKSDITASSPTYSEIFRFNERFHFRNSDFQPFFRRKFNFRREKDVSIRRRAFNPRRRKVDVDNHRRDGNSNGNSYLLCIVHMYVRTYIISQCRRCETQTNYHGRRPIGKIANFPFEQIVHDPPRVIFRPN